MANTRPSTESAPRQAAAAVKRAAAQREARSGKQPCRDASGSVACERRQQGPAANQKGARPSWCRKTTPFRCIRLAACRGPGRTPSRATSLLIGTG
eukprot:12026626-Alexandrium_andersonii.AAC.1